jgi:hypothetical protein
MGLKFGDMMLSQSNLITNKKGTFSSPDPHQKLFVSSNFP